MTPAFLGGHVRVGFTSARGGRFGLSVSRTTLEFRGQRTYAFRPEQVVAFEPDGPAWFSRGFRIRHNRADVPGRVYFACSGGRDVILAAVQSAGFVPCGAPFEGWRRPGIGRLVVIAMAIASALMLWR